MKRRSASKKRSSGVRILLKELMRRHVVQIGITYAVGAWLIVQVASIVLPAFHAAGWTLQAVIVLAVLGLPVALVLSWIFDITPQGLVRTDDVDLEQFPEPSRPALPRPVVTERRQLTALNARLRWVGADRREADAEDLRAALARYKTLLSGIAERYDGRFARSDAHQVLMYFGFPDAHEDDARRAAASALTILEETNRFNDEDPARSGLRVSASIGIDSDTAVVESRGETNGEVQIIGNVLDRAEWLPTLGGENTIYTSEATQRLLAGYYDLRCVGEKARNGSETTAPVYELLGRTAAQSRLEAGGRLTRLVGREAETALLKQRWTHALDGRGQVVLISGESGLGKSRLVHELKLHAAEESRATIHELACFADYQNSVLRPVLVFLSRQLREPSATEEKPVTLSMIEQHLSREGFDLPSSVPLMADLMGVDPGPGYAPLQLAPELQKSKTLELLLRLLLAPSLHAPLLLIIDDYHWADATFRELVEMVVAQGPAARILVLVVTRPEGIPEWIRRTHVTQMSVGPLTTAETSELIAAVGEHEQLPADVVAQLVENSQGNPLFAEELTRGVIDLGRARSGDNADHEPFEAAGLQIPLTLRESLLARLDRLSVGARTVVKLAAALGRQFSYELAAAFAESLEVRGLEDHLRQLVGADIIYQHGLPPAATYTFRHVLIQEAAYQSVLKRERESYHAHIAELLRTRFAARHENEPELLAWHLTAAGNIAEAVPLWLAAGRSSSRKAAQSEACSLLRHGLSLLKKLPPSRQRDALELEFQIALGPALMAVRGYSAQEVKAAYRRAEQLSNAAESTLAIAPVLFGLWTHHVVAGNLTRAVELGARLRSIAENSDDEDLLLESHVLLGVTQSYIGPMPEAREHLVTACAMYDRDKHAGHAYVYGQDPKMASSSYLGVAHWWLGYGVTAGRCIEEAISHARELSHPRSLAFALANGARAQLKRGDFVRCAEIGAEAAELSRAHGFPDFLAMGHFHRVAAEFRMDGDEGALEAMQESLRDLIAVGNSLSVPYYCSVVAEGLSAKGKFGGALEQLTHAEQQLAKHGHDLDAAEVHRVRGLLEWRRQDAGGDAAKELHPERSLRRAHALAEREGASSWRLQAAVSLGAYLGERDEAPEARAIVHAALEDMPETAHLPAFTEARNLLDRL